MSTSPPPAPTIATKAPRRFTSERARIRHLIRDDLGLKDMATYKTYSDAFVRDVNPRVPTAAEIALLSPDTIDNRAFWEAAEDLFKTDPVSNCQFGAPLAKMDGNRRNLMLYRCNGFLTYLEMMGLGRENILEIGPGYGTFKNWIEVNTGLHYHGADVYPKIPDVEHTQRNGLLSAATKARTYHAVVSCNVFQHLSVTQRRTYYKDVHDMLVPHGVFMVSLVFDTHAPDAPFRDSEGKVYLRHYGQFTEIQTLSAIHADLAALFIIDQQTMWAGHGNVGFICRKRAAPQPVEAQPVAEAAPVQA